VSPASHTYTGAAAKLGVALPVSTPQQQQQQQQVDPWTQGLIRLQYLPPELQGDPQAVQAMLKAVHKASQGPFLHKQKNWNPFIYKDELYFSQVGLLVRDTDRMCQSMVQCDKP
jgi:hypothetical protein